MAKEKILICDDEEGVRKSLSLILSEKYSVVFAENGEEALQILKNSADIKVVLLDIKMPRKSGLDVLKEIKSHNKQLPVIIVTGYQSVETAAEVIKNGASNYIVKPFDSKVVLDIVRKTVS